LGIARLLVGKLKRKQKIWLLVGKLKRQARMKRKIKRQEHGFEFKAEL